MSATPDPLHQAERACPLHIVDDRSSEGVAAASTWPLRKGRGVRCLRGERPSVGEDADRRSRGRQAPVAAVQAVRWIGDAIGENGVGSPVDPHRLGDTMSTRTIAIAALVIAVVIVVILFVI
jgi:hypothetical protein